MPVKSDDKRRYAVPGRAAVERTADLSEQMLGQITDRAIETARGFMRSIDGALPRHGPHGPRGSGRRIA